MFIIHGHSWARGIKVPALRDLRLSAKGPFRTNNTTTVTEIITKLVRWEFSPEMFLSKITQLIIGEFSSGVVHCRILYMEFWSACRWICERQGVFGNGPE